MSKTELQEKRGRLVTQAREALEEIKKNTDEARAKDLDTRHDTIMAELDILDATIAREDRVAAAEAREAEDRAKKRPNADDGQARAEDVPAKIEYREVFRKIVSGVTPGELSSEERAVLKAGATEFRAQTASTTTAGGYTVPVTLSEIIVKTMAMWGPMYDPGICTEILTSSGEQINIPTIDDTAVAVVRHLAAGEGVALTDDGGSDVTVGTKRLDAYIFDTEFVRWSIELSQDSIHNWETLLGELLGERLARRANVELTTGDGSGDPNGIVTASSLGVTAASATALTFDEIIDLEHSVDPAYRQSPKARFMFSDSTLKVLRKLKDGEGRYLWSAGDVTKGVAATLNGRPFSINQAMAAVATGNKSMIFGDFGKYFVRKVGSPIIGVMRERFWPDLGIAGLIRFDGELGDTAAVKHLIQS